MKGFQFRLARLQRVRSVEERAARERFVTAEHLARAAEDAVLAAEEDVRGAEAELRAEQSSTAVSPSRVLTALDALARLRERVQLLRDRAKPLRASAEAERTHWSERRRDLRGLERLEDRDRERWWTEAGRRDALAMDEVAGLRAAARDRLEASMERDSRSMNEGATP